MKSESVSHLVVSDSLWPHGLQPSRLLCHGILQARILEWVAMPSSSGSSHPRDRTQDSCLLHWQVGSLSLVPAGKPSPAKVITVSNSILFVPTTRRSLFPSLLILFIPTSLVLPSPPPLCLTSIWLHSKLYFSLMLLRTFSQCYTIRLVILKHVFYIVQNLQLLPIVWHIMFKLNLIFKVS